MVFLGLNDKVELMNILLYILSFILRTLFVTIGIIYDIIQIFKTSHFDRSFKYIDQKYRKLAILVDQFGNAACPEFWNDTLITKQSVHKFGILSQTISAVLGLNYEAGTLSKRGLWLNNALNFFWRDHTTRIANGDTSDPGPSEFSLLLGRIWEKIKNFFKC